MKKQVDMTTGSIPKLLISFAIPLLLGNLFQMFYNLVDTWVVGNYVGDTAFSAVGTVSPILNTFLVTSNGFANGAGIVIAQYFGAKQEDDVKKSVHTTVSISLILCVIFSVISFLLIPTMLHFMKSPEGVFEAQQTYLRITIGFLSFQILYNTFSAILRAIGDSSRPFIFLVAASITNIILDLVFVLKFNMGVAGVAWATIIAQGVSCICSLVVLLTTPTSVRIVPKNLHIDTTKAKQIIKIAIPTALQQFITQFSNVFVQGYTNAFGATVMGGWTIYSKTEQIVSHTQQSFQFATMTFVGQNLGAEKKDRAKKGIWSAIGVCTAFCLVLVESIMIFAPQVSGAFTESEAIIEYGVYFLRLISPLALIGTVAFVLTAAQRGAGNSTMPMLITLCSYVVIRQVYLYIASRIWPGSIFAVGLAYPVGWAACAITSIVYYLIKGLDSSHFSVKAK